MHVLHTHFSQRITKNIYDISFVIDDCLRLRIVSTPVLEHIPDFHVPNRRKQKRDSLQLQILLGRLPAGEIFHWKSSLADYFFSCTCS